MEAFNKPSPDVVAALTPTGTLRASINVGNPVLARRDAPSGQVQGVSVDLAQTLADRLGVALELVVFDKAAQSVDALASGRADVGFFAIDPQRGEQIAYSAPYLLIEGCYLVRDESTLQSNDEVDRAGTRVAVGQGSAYDLFLTRALTQAQIVRAPSAPEVVAQFVAQRLEVAAGVRQMLLADAERFPGLRLLPGRFMVIEQAMAIPAHRGQGAERLLRDFVEEMKHEGVINALLARHAISGATVAPATAYDSATPPVIAPRATRTDG